MINNKDSIELAYEDLMKKLNEITFEKEGLSEKLLALEMQEEKIKKALRSLLPHINDRVVAIDALPISKYKQYELRDQVIRILSNNPERRYTSPELLDIIDPFAKDLNKMRRRKLMTRLSLALIELVEKEKIWSEKNKGKKGNLYYIKRENFNEHLSIRWNA